MEYVYDSTAPAATPQKTQLGPAGPFSELTGSCTVSGSVVTTTLGATNSNNVTLDETRFERNAGLPIDPLFQTLTQPASGSPTALLGEANSSLAGDGLQRTTLIATAPVHGTLDVYEQASRGSNVCHISVTWTPAS